VRKNFCPPKIVQGIPICDGAKLGENCTEFDLHWGYTCVAKVVNNVTLDVGVWKYVGECPSKGLYVFDTL
jgi:hypothetical protein